MSKVYAYVTNECCVHQRAFLPGTHNGEIPVSRDGDLSQWSYGKRETLEIIKSSTSAHMRKSARLVADLRGWEYDD